MQLLKRNHTVIFFRKLKRGLMSRKTKKFLKINKKFVIKCLMKLVLYNTYSNFYPRNYVMAFSC
jgi:hypothetical protein